MHDLTEKIEPVHRRAFRIISTSASKEGVDWFLAGALARDWILTEIYNIDTLRATFDADLALALPDWDTFYRLRQLILDSGEFLPDKHGRTHRLDHSIVGGFHLDLSPYGPLAGEEAKIAWPPTHDTVMNVIGFEDAYRAAITVLVEADLPVRVSSPAGLIAMKILAWEDRKYHPQNKDARDIRLLLDKYEVVAGERLHEEGGVMVVENFDADRASARLLGRDVASILTGLARQRVAFLVDRELGKEGAGGLIGDLLRMGSDLLYEEENFERMRSLVQSFRNGFDD